MKRFPIIVATLLTATTLSAIAAPLFPDVKDDHWAKDAVAALAAKGLLEGYPDGTFKGDRAASRWEVAMIVARLLAKMEQAHATFATKAELDEVRKLAVALKDELDALGVRVTNLEENVNRLDKRVTEIERITFYGEVQARAVAQTFHNTGIPAMKATAPGVNVNTIDYNAAVGSNLGAGGFLAAPSPAAGLPNNYFVTGIPGVTDWLTGRPLTNGAGMTSKAILGLNVKVSPDVDAGVEFAAYSSQGNSVVNGFWGISAPYQSNPFTSSSSSANTPWTNMTLDHFWVTYKPTGTTVVVGAISNTDFDSFSYKQEPNPNVGGPAFLDSYGVQVRGKVKIDPDKGGLYMSYEVLGTLLADGNVDLLGSGLNYQNHAEGANIAFHWNDDRGVGRLNWLHAANDAPQGAAGTIGLIQLPNLVYNWVNPAGYYYQQLGGGGPRLAGIGSTSDSRPIAMAGGTDGITGVPGSLNVGGIGPQDQTNYGASIQYKFDNEYNPHVSAEYGHTIYKPNKQSGYSVSGDLFRLGAGASFFKERPLDVDLHYVKTDATYDPFVLQIPSIGGIYDPMWRIPDLNQLWNIYSLHDTSAYPQNRQGIKADLTWHFNPNGKVYFGYSNLSQVQTSLEDVRYSPSSLALGAPNTPVLGFSPGFVDTVFLGLSPYTFAPSGGNALAIPLENPKGNEEAFTILASHKWKFDDKSDRGVTLSGLFLNHHWTRDSGLAGILPGPNGLRGEDQNYVDLTIRGAQIGIGYDVTDDFHLRAAYTQLDVFGHLDPLGVYANYAASSGTTRFNTWDITQGIPEIGFDWHLSDKTTWSLGAKYFIETDHMPSTITASPSLPTLNVASGPNTAHPFGYEGIQVMSTFSVKF